MSEAQVALYHVRISQTQQRVYLGVGRVVGVKVCCHGDSNLSGVAIAMDSSNVGVCVCVCVNASDGQARGHHLGSGLYSPHG